MPRENCSCCGRMVYVAGKKATCPCGTVVEVGPSAEAGTPSSPKPTDKESVGKKPVKPTPLEKKAGPPASVERVSAKFDQQVLERQVSGLLAARDRWLRRVRELLARAEETQGRIRAWNPASGSRSRDERCDAPLEQLARGLEAAGVILAKLEQLKQSSEASQRAIEGLRAELNRFWCWLVERLFGGQRGRQIVAHEQELAGLQAQHQRELAGLARVRDRIQGDATALGNSIASELQQYAQQLRQLGETFDVALVGSWSDTRWHDWRPGVLQMPPVLRIGGFQVNDRRELADVVPGTLLDRVAGGVCRSELPAFVPFIGENRTVLIRCDEGTEAEGLSLLQSLLLRIATLLPHQSLFTLLDPAGHGRAFPMRRYLPRVSESHEDINSDLRDVIARIRHVMHNVLDFAPGFHLLPETTLASEPFEFIFAADFPRGYDHRAIETLLNIGGTGPLAGRYLFVQYNVGRPLPRDLVLESLENVFEVDLTAAKRFRSSLASAAPFIADAAPAGSMQQDLFQRLEAAKPPDHAIHWTEVVDLPTAEWWRGEVGQIVRSPVGGNTGDLRVWFGVNEEGRPCAHGMLAAMTGQGKSNLYHALILGLAIRYSPEDLHLYLVDGKDGVEFLPYEKLPHARVVSLKSPPDLSPAA